MFKLDFDLPSAGIFLYEETGTQGGEMNIESFLTSAILSFAPAAIHQPTTSLARTIQRSTFVTIFPRVEP